MFHQCSAFVRQRRIGINRELSDEVDPVFLLSDAGLAGESMFLTKRVHCTGARACPRSAIASAGSLTCGGKPDNGDGALNVIGKRFEYTNAGIAALQSPADGPRYKMTRQSVTAGLR